MNTITLTTPLTEQKAQSLSAGVHVLLSGILYTARDAAHKRLCSLINEGKELPITLQDQVLYYVGPTPARPGKPIGSAGPTTSCRMDAYSPLLMEKAGVRGMIGKGDRSRQVIDAMKKFGCVYFAAIGGAGALLAKCITKADIVCYDDLGPEAIYKLEVVQFPVIVAIDTHGNSCFAKRYC